MDNDLMARRLRPPSQPTRPTNGFSAPPESPSPTPWAALPDGRSDDQPLISSTAEGQDVAAAADHETHESPIAPAFDNQLRSDVPWDRPDPEPWPPVAEWDTEPQVEPEGQTAGEMSVSDEEQQHPAPAFDSTSAFDSTPTFDNASVSDERPAFDVTGWEADRSDAEVSATQASATSVWGSTAPWEPTAQTEDGYVQDAEPQSDSAVWSEHESAGSVAEPSGDSPWGPFGQVEAVAEQPPSADAMTAPWDTLTTDDASLDVPAEQVETAAAWPWAAPTQVNDVPVPAPEPIEETWDVPSAESTPLWEGSPAPTETTNDNPEWQWAGPVERWKDPFESWQRPPAHEVEHEEPDQSPEAPAVAIASVEAAHADSIVAPVDDSTDTYAEGQPTWDMPEPFEMDDYAMDELDDRPTDMLASYDDMIPMVTAAVAGAHAERTDVEVPTATAFETAADDPDDAMAPVLEDVEQPHVPNWTLWQAPIDLDAPSVVDATPSSANDAGPAVAEQTVEPQPAPSTAHVLGAEIATNVGEAVVHQLPALYSTAPYGIQQPLVVRIELTIVDEGNKVRAAEMARPVGPWSDIPVDTDEFADDTEGEDDVDIRGEDPQRNPPKPAAQSSSSGNSAWSIPALDDDAVAGATAPETRTAAPERDAPLADLPAAGFATADQAHAPTDRPAWFDSAAPVKPATPVKSVSPLSPSSNGDQSDLPFLASEPGGYVYESVAEKPKSSRFVMAGATFAMAVFVVLLVFVFVSQMTALLK